jgi:deoxyribodipyrimidine photo-lyase
MSNDLGKPLLIFEALRCGYQWASPRLHAFIIQGMKDNLAQCRERGISYFPYLEENPGDGKGLLEALAEEACLIITDDFPAFFLPRMVAAAATKVPVRMEKVDSNGLLPMRVPDKPYTTAYSFRRMLQKTLPDFLTDSPDPSPLDLLGNRDRPEIKKSVLSRWPAANSILSSPLPDILPSIHMDHSVAPVEMRGGTVRAKELLDIFVGGKLSSYAEMSNHPDEQATSGLSPYLHFGHISAHEVFDRIARSGEWSPDKLSCESKGKRSGWWGMDENSEAFLDQLITWRELGFNVCAKTDDYDSFESLPEWAQKTINEHLVDQRPHIYSLEDFESAQTHEILWNAAQNQLLQEGIIHNYLRMVWGKKIFQWTQDPREALRIMIHLNNKYALDGRDPNSYTGILWILGKYDRPWGPERPVFGKIRYMSEKNTIRKLRVSEFLDRYGKQRPQ